MVDQAAGQWQVAGRRHRGKPRRGRPPIPTSSSRRGAGEAVDPVAEVSEEKQQQIVARARAIAGVLRHSSLVGDALHEITTHFAAESTSDGEVGAHTNVASAGTMAKDEQKSVDDANAHSAPELGLVGYGLGSFCASSNAVHQLGFLVALRDALVEHDRANSINSSSAPSTACASSSSHLCVEIFDPAMNKSDAVIAECLGLAVLQENERGRRRVARPTVFFMPHCGKALYQNVLACNWGLAARKIVIIGNSFEAYSDRVLGSRERQELLLVRVRPYLQELPLSCGVAKSHEDFARYEAAFNDLSVHRFPLQSLRRALQDDAALTQRMAFVAADTHDLLDGELVAGEAQT